MRGDADDLIPTCPTCGFTLSDRNARIVKYEETFLDLSTMRAGQTDTEGQRVSPREAQILRLLLMAEGSIVSYGSFEDVLWPHEQRITFNLYLNVQTHVCNLRRKGLHIRTVCGVGYAIGGQNTEKDKGLMQTDRRNLRQLRSGPEEHTVGLKRIDRPYGEADLND